jgi:hypothetical protein
MRIAGVLATVLVAATICTVAPCARAAAGFISSPNGLVGVQ